MRRHDLPDARLHIRIGCRHRNDRLPPLQTLPLPFEFIQLVPESEIETVDLTAEPTLFRRMLEPVRFFGADDIDGTVRHELIYHDAGATTPEVMSVEDIERIIREAGREPIERDTLYRRVERDAESWRVGEKITAGV